MEEKQVEIYKSILYTFEKFKVAVFCIVDIEKIDEEKLDLGSLKSFSSKTLEEAFSDECRIRGGMLIDIALEDEGVKWDRAYPYIQKIVNAETGSLIDYFMEGVNSSNSLSDILLKEEYKLYDLGEILKHPEGIMGILKGEESLKGKEREIEELIKRSRGLINEFNGYGEELFADIRVMTNVEDDKVLARINGEEKSFTVDSMANILSDGQEGILFSLIEKVDSLLNSLKGEFLGRTKREFIEYSGNLLFVKYRIQKIYSELKDNDIKIKELL